MFDPFLKSKYKAIEKHFQTSTATFYTHLCERWSYIVQRNANLGFVIQGLLQINYHVGKET